MTLRTGGDAGELARRRVIAPFVLVALALLPACAGAPAEEPSRTPVAAPLVRAGGAALIPLDENLEPLRSDFDRGRDRARLVAIVSPT